MSAGQIIGATIGFVLGGPKGAYWGYMAGSIIDPPPGPNLEGPRLTDTVVQTSEEGAPLAAVFGTVRIAGNVIWSSGLEEIKKKEDAGGGSGGGGATYTTYSYKTDAAIALCSGEITVVRRIWADAKLIYDVSETADLNTLLASDSRAAGIRVYTGSETQEPDPLIQAIEGAANTPAFRGMAYVVFEDLQLADFGNRLPNFSFEVVQSGNPLALTFLQSSDEISGLVHPVRQDADFNLYGFSTAGAIGSYFGSPYGNGSYYKIDLDGNTKTLFSGDLDISIPGYTYLLTNYQSYNHVSILYAPDELNIIVREFYAQKSSVYQGGFLVYLGSSNGKSFSLTPDYSIDMPGILIGAWGGTIAFRNATEGICSCNRYGPLVYFKNGVVTATLQTSLTDGIGGMAFFEDRFLVVRLHNSNYAVFYWYDYTYNLIDQVTSTVVYGKRYFSFNENDQCLYGVNSASSLLKVGPVNISASANDSEVVSVDGAILPGRTAEVSMNCIPLVDSESDNVLFFSQNLTSPNGLRRIVAKQNMLQKSTAALDDVAAHLIEQSGLTAADYDVTALASDSVRGYVVGRPMSGRAALEPLQTAYHFDLSERDGKIYAIKRGGSVVATIEDDDLGAAETPDGIKVQLTRHNETELPSEIQISYSDIDNDHQAGTQYARSLTAQATNIRQISLPLSMTSQEAAQLAEVILNASRYTGRHTLEFNLGYAWSRLAPADVVSLPAYGVQWTARLGQIDMGAPGLVQCVASPEVAALYASILAGADAANIGQSIGLTGTTTLNLLDCALLRDDDDSLGWYVALTGSVDTWPGGALYKSNDGGATWALAASAARLQSARIGTVAAALPNADCRVWDKANTLSVRLQADATLSSTTEANLLAGGNSALIGADGRWEIVQFLTATLETDGSYTLRDLLRGRKGTEHAAASHAAGDTFILLDANTLQDLPAASAELNAAREYKALTLGQALEAVSAESLTYTGERLRCLSPVELGGGRDASGNLTLTWKRRDRINHGWNDYADIPMSEASQAYEVDIYDSTYATLKRTLTGLTSATASYTSADQTTDFGSNQATVYARIYQLSATTGRGHYLQGSI